MKDKYHTVQEYVNDIYKRLYPREKAIVDAIKEKGFFIKYDLNEVGLDESQGPRAIKDLEDRGIPIKRLSRIYVSQAKNPITRYTYGDPQGIDSTKQFGRQTSEYALKKKLIAAYGARCVFCGRKLPSKELQIDHKLPVKYFGELSVKERDNIRNYQLVCKQCNKKKERAIEVGCAKTCFTTHNMDVIKSCYWYDPNNYTHICMNPYRELIITFNSPEELRLYNKLKQKASENGKTIQKVIKKLVE